MAVNELALASVLLQTNAGAYHFASTVRVCLVAAAVIGLSRRTLIDSLGAAGAQRLVARAGLAQGWHLASAVRGPVTAEAVPTMIQRVLSVLGFADPTRMDPPLTTPSFRLIHSCEAEQQREHFADGSVDPVCWFAAGFAAGYCARLLGCAAVCIEERCAACGDGAECWFRLEVRDDCPLDPEDPSALDLAGSYLLRALGIDDGLIPFALASPGAGDAAQVGMQSPRMRRVLALAHQAAQTIANVLITGETGVGKGHLARFIHEQSDRARGPFVAVNCAALPEQLLEAELFGHARGAFTGAVTDRKGLFEAAHTGTIFLDEIAELPKDMQAKLLHVLQDRVVRRVGETRVREIDVRVIAATNRDLAAEMGHHRFRQDLYYRLDVIALPIPPLRDRPDDLRALAEQFARQASHRSRKPMVGFTASALDRVLAYHWPGNIRELENVIERACALSNAQPHIDVDDLPELVRGVVVLASPNGSVRPLRIVEREHILAAIKCHHGNKTRAAADLGIGLATLHRKLRQYGSSPSSSVEASSSR